MAYYLSPIFQDAQLASSTGVPLVGGKLYTYVAGVGSTTPITVYQDDLGGSTHTNPIILNARGEPPAPIWISGGQAVKFQLNTAADVLIRTVDDVTGVNDPTGITSTPSEWVTLSLEPTYSNSVTFTVSGNQTATLMPGRRLKIPVSGNTSYCTILTSTYSAPNTTVVVDVAGSVNLDSSIDALTSFEAALLTGQSLSTPPVVSTLPFARDVTDATKRVRMDASGLPTATTRVLYPTLPSSTKSGTYSLVEADYGGVLYCSSSFTLTLTTSLGAGFQCWVKNTGTGTITLSASSGVIYFPGAANAGASTATLPYSGSTTGPYNVSGVLLQCDGTNWHVVATDEAHGEQLFTSSGSWVAPAGVTTIWLDGAAQGGGGGGVGTNAGSAAGGGGGGQAIKSTRYSVVPGTTYTITLANTGGVGGVGNNAGTAGSNAQFDSLVTLTGGSGGANSNGPAGAGGATGGTGGTAGGNGFNITGTTSAGGAGGASIFGAPGAIVFGTQAGRSASGYGAGGGGAVEADTSTQNGGAGAPGFFAVRW